MEQPLVLDFDASLRGFSEALHLDLNSWQERVRFGCGWSVWRHLESALDRRMHDAHGTVFMGSGDFHHVSHLLIKRLEIDECFDVIVCDNHPDNMVFPFGIHCGSWVKHVAMLPQVRRIHVVGITSSDAEWSHAWENRLFPLYQQKVFYWTIGIDTSWANVVGLSGAIRSFPSSDAMLAALEKTLAMDTCPVYLSIDKDVLSVNVARTNWDQGWMTLDDLRRLIQMIAGRVVGSDVTGEVSIHRYGSRWKRILSAIDDQPPIDDSQLINWQTQQLEVNRTLLRYLSMASM